MDTNFILLADATTATIIVLSLIAAAAAIGGAMLARKNKQGGTVADQPPQLSSRGSYIPIVMGQRRVGPVIGWVGDKVVEDSGSGGGSNPGGQAAAGEQFYGGAWHMLCVGPAYALNKIRDNEKEIYNTRVTIDDTPSGTVLECIDGSTFEIYWGECDQPVNDELAMRVGVRSKWPNVCYIRWIKKLLGGSNAWPQLDYDIEVRPVGQFATIVDAPGWIEESDDPPLITGTTVWFDHMNDLPAGDYIVRYIRGAMLYRNGHPDEWQLNTTQEEAGLMVGWHIVDEDNVSVVPCPGTTATYGNQYGVEADNPSDLTFSEFTWTGGPLGLYLHDPDNYEDNSPGAPAPTYQLEDMDGNTYIVTGIVAPEYTLPGSGDSGYNLGHFMWQIMTAVYPHGFGIDVDDLNYDAFETVARWGHAERLAINALIADGEMGDEMLKGLMSEVGMFLLQVGDVLKPYMIRRPTVASPTIPGILQLQNYPEEEKQQGSFLPDRPTFAFNDRTINFRSNVVDVRGDGRARGNNRPNPQDIKLNFITDPITARSVANRRRLEFTNAGHQVSPSSTRQFRRQEFHPGRTFFLEGDPTLYRLMSKELSTQTPAVKLQGMADAYLTLPSEASVDTQLPAGTLPLQAVPDLAVRAVVLPSTLYAAGPALAVLRVRAHAQIAGARILLSTDDVTYFELGSQTYYNLAGTINRPIPIDEGAVVGDLTVIEEGPSFARIGNDTTQVVDLTGNDGAYLDSRQMALINDELFLLRSVSAVSGGYQMNDMAREAHDTLGAAHPSNSEVWIILKNRVKAFPTTLITDGVTLYIKSVPYTLNGDTVDPASVTPYELVIP